MSVQEIEIRMLGAISEISAESWDACADHAAGPRPENPFTTHRFLSALEESGSASAQEGWAPHHLVAQTAQGQVLGVAPLYLKNHSQGEYVFDYGWAEAFTRAGGRYYPKLQCSAPFTPATGRRLLTHPDAPTEPIMGALAQGASQIAAQNDVSSVHVTFCTKHEWDFLGQAGYLLRQDQQFHWENAGYGAYDDFLAQLSSRKRKQLRKERAQALAGGVEIVTLTSDAIEPQHWDAFWLFYQDTGARKWGTPYLTRAFFEIAQASMRDDIALVMCRREGAWIAGALNFIGAETLYGRYWGCIEHHPSLHFEACYHRAMDFAIERKLKFVEAGAQGQHKIARGYTPKATYSAHWIAHPGFRKAVAEYLEHERGAVAEEIEILTASTPFKRGG